MSDPSGKTHKPLLGIETLANIIPIELWSRGKTHKPLLGIETNLRLLVEGVLNFERENP